MRPAIGILDVREVVVPGVAIAYQVARVSLEEFLGNLGGAGIGVPVDEEGVFVEGRVEKPNIALGFILVEHPQRRLVRMKNFNVCGQQLLGQVIVHRPDYLGRPHLVVAQRLPGDV